MKSRTRLGRFLLALGTGMAVFAPATAWAHDNLGGDELAVANWMLIAAIVVAAMGALAIIWAARAGQFSNVEESKFTMLDTAEDFDAIMAQADAAEAAAREKAATERTQTENKAAPDEVGREAKQPVGAERPARV